MFVSYFPVIRHIGCILFIIQAMVLSSASQSALVGRDLDGNRATLEAFYDTVLDVTWQANANLAATESFGISGITADGRMALNLAEDWVDAMNVNNYFGYTDWRLPEVDAVNGMSFDLSLSYDGSTDKGYGFTGDNSELAHLYYSTLGNLGRCASTSSSGCDGQENSGLVNTGPFSNMQSSFYTTQAVLPSNTAYSFFFSTALGAQTALTGENSRYVWSLRDGDSPSVAEIVVVGVDGSEVPLPTSIWLFASSLLALISIRRR